MIFWYTPYNLRKENYHQVVIAFSPLEVMIDMKQLENVEYSKYLRSMMTKNARCTREFKSRTAMTNAAFSRKKTKIWGTFLLWSICTLGRIVPCSITQLTEERCNMKIPPSHEAKRDLVHRFTWNMWWAVLWNVKENISLVYCKNCCKILWHEICPVSECD